MHNIITKKLDKREIQWVKFDNAVFCRRYVGTGWFNQRLEARAETGLWYCRISGNPFSIEGEGSTPELAVLDARNRNRAMIQQLRNANAALEKILENL